MPAKVAAGSSPQLEQTTALLAAWISPLRVNDSASAAHC